MGALGVFTGFVILSYYAVVAGWSLAYIDKVVVAASTPAIDHAGVFKNHISNVWEPIIWQALFMIITVSIIAAGVVKGIQRWSTILMPILFALLIILIVRSVTCPARRRSLSILPESGFQQGDGVERCLQPWHRPFFPSSWGMGAIMTYGSYLSDKDEIPANAAWVAGLDTAVARLAGFALFPAIFASGFRARSRTGSCIHYLARRLRADAPGRRFRVLFFFLLWALPPDFRHLASGSGDGGLIDEKGWARKKAAVCMGLVIFVVGLPATLGYSVLKDFSFPGLNTDLLDTYDWFANSIFLPVGGFLMALFSGYVWGINRAISEANKGRMAITVGKWWALLIRYVVPVLIFFIMAVGIYDTFIK